MTKPRRFYWVLAGVIVVLIIAAVAAGPLMSRVEQPEYCVEASEGPIEIRAYGPMIAAEAEVKGGRRTAIAEGFRLIAAYIFGANRSNAKIEMTAPVQQESLAESGPASQRSDDRIWTVRFIMPKKWMLESLPVPSDSRVSLVPLAAKRMAVIRFSGSADDGLIQAKTAELQRYISEHELTPVKGPLLAFYNPPWTLPLFRRNEVMFELAETSGAPEHHAGCNAGPSDR
jgi:hypothetical protein